MLLTRLARDITVATRMSTTAFIGRLDKFQMGRDDFDCYVKRLEQYFVANAILENKQVATFLTAIGGPTYELLKSLVMPAAPKDKDLTQLMNVLQAHLKPKPLTIAEWYKFHKRAQKEEETVAEFVLTLKGLAKHCNFGDFLNDALRDHLVCGLNKESIQRRLLAEADLTFQKACEIAQAMEMVAKDASTLNSEATKGVKAIQSLQRAQAGETTPKDNFEK